MARRPPPPRTIPDRPPARCPWFAYTTGTESLARVAEQLAGQPGCSLPRLKARCWAEGWVADRRAFRREVERLAGERLGLGEPAPLAWLSVRQQQRQLARVQRMAARCDRLVQRARRLAA